MSLKLAEARHIATEYQSLELSSFTFRKKSSIKQRKLGKYFFMK